jgi:hydroxyethylthiazole kinase-like uncharacterized protein yjeF
MLVTCSGMSEAERRFFADRSPEPWMDEAGRLCAAAILDFFPEPARAIAFCGKGNNGGDALVLARWLKRHGWETEIRCSGPSDDLSPLARRKLAEYEDEPAPADALSPLARPLVLIDGLVGIGARGDLRGPLRELAAEMNRLRVSEAATTFAIDLPSGFDADTGLPGPDAVVADVTLSINAPKTGFVRDGAEDHVGRLVEIPLPIPLPDGDETRRFLFPGSLRPRLPRRAFDTHKGAAGRIALVAGSHGMTGAAVLAALGASRGGAGLVTVAVPEDIYPIVATKAPAEVMVRPFRSFDEIAALPADVFGIGPGLGESPPPGLLEFLVTHPRPVVIDADALNHLARFPDRISALPPNRLLTPHPGEMARLARVSAGFDRADLARRFADEHGISLLLKGSRTIVASPGRPLEFNTTGHPGMASGGMGDVLTGLCTALAGQGLALHDAACVGSWLLGRAAELVVRECRIAPESVTAPLVAGHLGMAWRALETPGSP